MEDLAVLAKGNRGGTTLQKIDVEFVLVVEGGDNGRVIATIEYDPARRKPHEKWLRRTELAA